MKNQNKTGTQTTSKPTSALNHITQANCSQWDAAMKKYHSDIGSRLCEMFMPDQYSHDAGDNLSQDFCMLTIDTRHLRSLKQGTNSSQATSTSRGESRPDDIEDDASKLSTSAASTSQETSSRVSTTKEQENRSDRKVRLFDKLTCFLFLRKHMCSRCKRKSRSCVSNKMFSGTEQRYMCFRCRETSHAIKSVFGGQHSSKDSRLSHSTPEQLQSKERDISMHRKNIKDSGYDTVTSCSTVASAYSAFSTPANIRQNINKVSVKPMLYGDQQHISERNTNTGKYDDLSTKNDLDHYIPCGFSDLHTSSKDVADSGSNFSNFHTAGQPEFSEDEFRQFKQRNVTRYDGYLSDSDYKSWEQKKSRSILSDTSNLEESSESGDSCYFPPRIIRVSQNAKNTSSQKACYTCDSTSKPCFRLPWEGGWICEDCLDGLH